MKAFLLDTNIPSEMTKPRPSVQVGQWLAEVNDHLLFISVISLAEILRGIHRLPDNQHRANLRNWLNHTLRPWFHGRILPVSQPIAERLGVLAGTRDSQGKTLSFADGLIVATAQEHNLTLVTRNVRDFSGLDIPILNPFDR